MIHPSFTAPCALNPPACQGPGNSERLTVFTRRGAGAGQCLQGFEGICYCSGSHQIYVQLYFQRGRSHEKARCDDFLCHACGQRDGAGGWRVGGCRWRCGRRCSGCYRWRGGHGCGCCSGSCRGGCEQQHQPLSGFQSRYSRNPAGEILAGFCFFGRVAATRRHPGSRHRPGTGLGIARI